MSSGLRGTGFWLCIVVRDWLAGTQYWWEGVSGLPCVPVQVMLCTWKPMMQPMGAGGFALLPACAYWKGDLCEPCTAEHIGVH